MKIDKKVHMVHLNVHRNAHIDTNEPEPDKTKACF